MNGGKVVWIFRGIIVLILEDGEPYIVDTGLSSEDVTELNTAFETHKGEKWNF